MPATTPNPGPYDLGPFQTLTAIQWGTALDVGTVTAVTFGGSNLALATNCTTPLDGSAPVGHDELEFAFDPGAAVGVTTAQLRDGTYTGATSGATYRPGDVATTPECSTLFIDRFSGGSSRLSGANTIWQWLASIQNEEPSLVPALTTMHANYGSFLTRLPVPGSGITPSFINGERFLFSPP